MKNIGIIILSRYSSTRLPGKALIEINGTTLLGNIINNIKLNLPEVKCIVATSIHKSDDIIEKFCKNNLTNYFRGDLNNVAKRFLECSIKYKLDIAVRINGDNFFLDFPLLIKMISKLKEEKLDFVSNVPGRTFPYGMSIEVLNTSFFKSVYKQLNSEFDKEHVTSWIYENQNIGRRFYFKNKKYHNLHNVKLSIDEKKDIELVKKIISLNNYQNSISLSSLNILLDKIDII